jgi:hypothetical protein
VKKRLAAVVVGLALAGVVAPAATAATASAADATPAVNATAYPVCYTRVPVLNIGLCVPWAL